MAAPDTIADLLAWFQADAITGQVDGAEIGENEWVSSEGAGYVSQQYFGGLFPTYETNELNGKPIIRFRTDSQDKALRLTAPAPTGAQTVIVVARPSAVALADPGARIWSAEGGNLTLRIVDGTSQLLRIGGGLFLSGAATLTAATPYVLTATFTPATSAEIYVNGALDGSTSHAATLAESANTYLGASGLFGGDAFRGDIAEFIVYDRVLTSAERSTVHSYVQDKYGIAVADYTGSGPTLGPIPTTPLNLTATASAGQVALTWDASADDVAVTGYRIYRRGIQVGTTTGTTFTETGLAGGITYDYQVTAIDADGHESQKSDPASATTPEALQPGAPSILFDADLSSDVDDLLAVGMLHALADRGECRIIGMGVSSLNGGAVEALDAINTYYGRPDIPVARRPDVGGRGGYPATIGTEFPHDLVYTAAPLAVDLYRQLLAAAPDQSVTIVSTGYLTNLKALLNSPADGTSPLTGAQLIAAKVKLWVCMGGLYPSGGEFNFRSSGDDSAYVVVNNWPAAATFVGYEVGGEIFSGGRLLAETPATNPIRRGYVVVNGPAGGVHSSDGAALYEAVRPGAAFYGYVTTGRNTVDDAAGNNTWVSAPDPTGDLEQRYVLLLDEVAAGNAFDDLLVTPAATVAPASTGGSGVAGGGALTAIAGSLSGAGAVALTGGGALAPVAPTLTGAGAQRLAGAGALTAGAPSLSGAGTAHLNGAGSLTAPAPTLAGSGTVTQPTPGIVTGSGSLTAGIPALDGGAALRLTGGGALTAGAPTLAGISAAHVASAGALTPAAPTLLGTGALLLAGAATLLAQPATLTGTGTRRLVGAGALTAAPAAMRGSGTVVDASQFRDIAITWGELRTRQLTPVSFSARTLTGRLQE